ncbi:MAG: hypothetical protein ACK4WM_05360 [Thermoflexales bacterium]
MTRLGTITDERAYDDDPHKRQGRYLLDEQLGIQGQLSAGLEREMVRLGAYLPSEAADTTIWRRVQAARSARSGKRRPACGSRLLSRAPRTDAIS